MKIIIAGVIVCHLQKNLHLVQHLKAYSSLSIVCVLDTFVPGNAGIIFSSRPCVYKNSIMLYFCTAHWKLCLGIENTDLVKH